MLLQTNFKNVPDTVPLVEAGEYDILVESIELQPPKPNSKQVNPQFSFVYGILTEGDQKGRKLFDNFDSAELQIEKSRAAVRFKHLLLSAGIPISDQVDTDDLKGKTVRVLVAQRTYADKETQEIKSVANIVDYITPTVAAQGTTA